ncbi:MAG: carbohydrate kinase family protein, partial [Micromonosporaceae bacterium]
MAVAADPVAEGSDVTATVTMTGGGAAANTAAWLAYAGARATLVAAVGDDAIGEQRVAELQAYGVTCAVARREEATGTVIVLATGAERSMISDRGANASLTPADVDAALRQSRDCVHLHLSGYTLLDRGSRAAGQHALAAARAAGLSVSVDAASANPLRRVGPKAFLEWTRGVNLLLANLDEARALTADHAAAGDPTQPPEQLARALTAYADVVIVKLGPDGAVWAASDGATATAPAVS